MADKARARPRSATMHSIWRWVPTGWKALQTLLDALARRSPPAWGIGAANDLETAAQNGQKHRFGAVAGRVWLGRSARVTVGCAWAMRARLEVPRCRYAGSACIPG